jgi:hypothetical protein
MPRPLVNYPFVIGIPRPDNYFDHVRQRLLVTAIPSDKWKQHIQECARVCASGGWVEIVEMTGQFAEGGPACRQFNTWVAGGLKKRGVDLDAVQNLDELMREVGLINVTKQIFVAPFGSWSGKAGEFFVEDYKLANSGLQPLVTSVFGVPKEDVERNGASAIEEFDPYQAYMNIYVYFGQKQ